MEEKREREEKKISSNAPHKTEHSSHPDEFITHLSHLATTSL